MDSDGNEVVGGSFDKAKQEVPAAEPIVKLGGQRTRYDAATGEITVLSDGQDHRGAYQTANRPENSSPLDSAKSQTGMPLSRGELTPDSIISHPSLGGSMRLREALALGWAKQTPNGYVMAGDMVSLDAAPAAGEQEKPAADKSDEVSLENVPGTSAGADIVHKQLRTAAGEAVYAGLTTALIKGADTTAQIEELARRTGQSPEHVKEAVDGIYSEYSASAKAVAKANGVRSWDAFLAWASAEAPDAATDAMHELVSEHSAASLGRLAKQYARLGRVDYSNSEILSAKLGDGIKSREVGGKVVLSIPGHGEMGFDRAVREGIIRLS